MRAKHSQDRNESGQKMTAPSRRGAVLILTLIILAIVGSWLAMMTNEALRSKALVDDAENELQVRWAQQSVQTICLDNSEILLSGTLGEFSSSTPWIPIKLGDVEYQVRIADEQAKVNIAKKLEGSSVEDVAATLRRLAPLARADLVGLRTAKAHSGVQSSLVVFDQLWIDVNPRDLFGREGKSSITQSVTLWGDGKINLSRASDKAAIESLKGILTHSEVMELLGLYRESSMLNTAEILSSFDISNDQKNLLVEQLTQESLCHSVVIRYDRQSDQTKWRFVVQCLPEDTENDGSSPLDDTSAQKDEQSVWVQLW